MSWNLAHGELSGMQWEGGLARWQILLMATKENEGNHKKDSADWTAHVCTPSTSYAFCACKIFNQNHQKISIRFLFRKNKDEFFMSKGVKFRAQNIHSELQSQHHPKSWPRLCTWWSISRSYGQLVGWFYFAFDNVSSSRFPKLNFLSWNESARRKVSARQSLRVLKKFIEPLHRVCKFYLLLQGKD